MKRKALCACMAMLVVVVAVLLVPMTAGASTLTAAWDAEYAPCGTEVSVTVSVDGALDVKSGAVSVTYSAELLEPVSGTWQIDAPIKDYDMTTHKGVFILEETAAVSGALLTLTFRVKDTAQQGDEATVTCTPTFRDAEEAAVSCDPAAATLIIGTDVSGMAMAPITSVYQYVSGGVDNSSLNGLAEDNSAVYMYNGTLRTAFRVPATYQTDSEDLSTILLNGESYPVVERGIILGTQGQELTVDSALKSSITSGFGSKYWACEQDAETGIRTVTYTALVKNLTREMKDTGFIARAYVRIDLDGVEYVVYSDVSEAFTSQQLYDGTVEILEAQGKEAPTWFTNDKTDDGVVELP